MATLTGDIQRTIYEGKFHEFPMVAADIIYGGAAIGLDAATGYARPLVAGDPFLGFADYRADNATGAAGDVFVRVRKYGQIQLPIAGLAMTSVGKEVYAADDNTFTLTAGTNTRIGFVSSFIEAGIGIVEFEQTSGLS